ncbi:VirB4 family type IV secretion system protein [Azospirillum sp. B4]|uniref:VirB4 family type IV secretion system protein n=1 Tax=Azospirillum sp. B4 TaxID=95605 RepID=UPI0005CA8792|nr:VirB4 family type IV secretion system protein [Azospirillum sp. B4]
MEMLQQALVETTKGLSGMEIRTRSANNGSLPEFWRDITSGGLVSSPRRTVIPTGTLGEALWRRFVGAELAYNKWTGLIEHWIAPRKRRYTLCVVVPNYGPESVHELLEQLMSVGGEITVNQMINPYEPGPMPPRGALYSVKSRRRHNLAARVAGTQAFEEFNAAQSRLDITSEDGADAYADYQMMIFCHGSTPQEAVKVQEQVVEVVDALEMDGVVERGHCVQAWSTQLPTYDWMVRGIPVYGQNIGEWVSFDRPPSGSKACDWGRGQVLNLPTWTGNRYGINFHKDEHQESPGMTVVFGEIGSGKTTGVQMAATGTLVNFPAVRVTVLDRAKGMFVWTRAMEGTYVDVQREVPGMASVQLNFLQLDLDEPDNQAHVRSMFRAMTGTGVMDERAEADYSHALELLRKAPPRTRKLKEIVQHAFTPDGQAYKAMQPFIDPQQHGKVFDVIDNAASVAATSRLITYDVEKFIDDPRLGPPLILDIFHRHRMAARQYGVPSLLILEELRALIKNLELRSRIEERVLEGRKGREVLVLVSQYANLSKHDPAFHELIRTQTQTWIVFPNHAGTDDDYEWMGLTERMLAFCTGRSPLVDYARRPAMLYRPGTKEAVFVYFDIADLGLLTMLFKSGVQYWRKLIELQQRLGPGVHVFEQYMEVATGFAARGAADREIAA